MTRQFSLRYLLTLCLAVSTMTGAAFAQDERTTEKGRKDGMTWRKETVTATVNEVMPDSGMVVLEDPQGAMWTLRVDEKVDLGNLKIGDRVRVEYYESQALEFREPTPRDRREPLIVEEEAEAPRGVNPKAGKLREIRALVQVTKINEDDNTVTVQGPLGRYFVLDAIDPAMLDTIAEGDEWVVIFREGVAVSITKL